MSGSPTIDELLGPEGLIAGALERYEHRPQQIEMARAVERALAEKSSLIVEAATGTGKTLAYLLPALQAGKRVVVSTGTKALQEQLFHKDIPFLAEHWPKPFKAVILKGRRNYLCKWRLDSMMLAPRFRSARDASMWPRIQAWAAGTETGDRAEIEGMPDDYATWNELSISSESCLGGKCRHYEECFITQARKRSREADVIVVNHHLFFADLALRHDGVTELLPDYDAVIFDEAHHLEHIASSYFGMQVSNVLLREIINDIKRALREGGASDKELDESLRQASTSGTSLFTLLSFMKSEGRHELTELIDGDASEKIDGAWQHLAETLTRIESLLKAQVTRGLIQDRVPRRVAQFKFDLDQIMYASDIGFTYYADIRDKNVFLHAEPIDLATILRERLLDTHRSLIFTSATLSTNNDFSYFKQRLGMNELLVTTRSKRPSLADDSEAEGAENEAEEDTAAGEDSATPGEKKLGAWPVEELLLDAVFNYQEQCLVYVPNRLPPPNHPRFRDGVVQIVEYLLGISQGRAFVLFTSWANMHAVHQELAPKLDVTVLRQGDRPKRELIDMFKADTHSVLFATSSFWEGVDVEGDALKLVIMDKLPFASPGDPVISARIKHLEEQGGNPFMEFSVPQAALTLKQGFGRLIRSSTDTGVVAILDSRIATKRYGRHFLESLPPAPVVWRATEVKHWWRARFGDPDAPAEDQSATQDATGDTTEETADA